MRDGVCEFPVIDATGSPRQLGEAHGRAARVEIARGVAYYRRLVGGLPHVGEFLAAKATALSSSLPDLHEELTGVAAGAGVAAEDVMLLNARSELLSIGWQGSRLLECTAVAIAGERTPGGAAVVGQTWDWLPAVERNTVVVRGRPHALPAFLAFAEAGQLGKIGLNAAGLAVCLNFLHCPPAEWRQAAGGVPVHLLARAVLGTRSITEAVTLLRAVPRGGAVSLVMAEAGGRVAAVEVSPTRVDVMEPADGLVAHGNDFECRARPDAVPFTDRCLQVRRLLDARPKVAPADLVDVFCHHEGAGRICHHPAAGDMTTSTLAALVLEPADGHLTVRRGPTCRHREAGQVVALSGGVA